MSVSEKEKALPAMCQRGAEPDRVPLLRQLINLWLDGGVQLVDGKHKETRTQKMLAEKYGILPQNLSKWATMPKVVDGQPPRRSHPAPWWLVMRLAYDVGVVVVIDPAEGVRIYTAPERKNAD